MATSACGAGGSLSVCDEDAEHGIDTVIVDWAGGRLNHLWTQCARMTVNRLCRSCWSIAVFDTKLLAHVDGGQGVAGAGHDFGSGCIC